MPGNLIVDAVKRGEGVTFSARQWFAEELASGELLGAFPETDPGVFYIEQLSGEDRPHVQKVVDWLIDEAGLSHRISD